MRRKISLITVCISIVIIILNFNGCTVKKNSAPKDNGILISPSSIEIQNNNTVVVFNKTDDKYKEIFDLVKRDWDNSLDAQGLPPIVQLMYMYEFEK